MNLALVSIAATLALSPAIGPELGRRALAKM